MLLKPLPYLLGDVEGRRYTEHLAIETEYVRPVGVAQLGGAFDHRIEHSAEIERRVAHRLQYVGGRGLLLHQFVPFGGAFSKFALKFCDGLLGIGYRVVQCLGHFALRFSPMNLREQRIQKDRAALVVQSLFIGRALPRAASQHICCRCRRWIICDRARPASPEMSLVPSEAKVNSEH
ncbi:MAG TPA: hypothetical protein VE999_07090 [Gemmataceae bacterium]|nr:hypothetical protein [Gemmataceae bacterium]